MEDDRHLLELTLISAQGLKSPFSSNMRRLQTFAVAWIQPSTKLRTRIDRVGCENPTWNDKFLFRVSPSFLAGETSAITVEIFGVGILKDPLLGSVRILLSNFLPRSGFLPTAPAPASAFASASRPSPSALPSTSSSSPDLRLLGNRTPAFGAFQIRRPSGRFQGILNVAAVVVDVSDFGSLAGLTAIGYHDLMGKRASNRRKHRQQCKIAGKSETGEDSSVDESLGGEFTEMSDGGESTTSTSSAAASPRILREMNGQELNQIDCGGGGILCWLGLPRKIHISPSDENFRAVCSSEQIKRL